MFYLKGNYAMAIQDPAIAAEREKVEFKRAMNPCPPGSSRQRARWA